MSFDLAHWPDSRKVVNTGFSDSYLKDNNKNSEDLSNSCKTRILSFVQSRRLRDLPQERAVGTRTLSPGPQQPPGEIRFV